MHTATRARLDRLRARSPLWVGAGLVAAAALVTAAAGDARRASA